MKWSLLIDPIYYVVLAAGFLLGKAYRFARSWQVTQRFIKALATNHLVHLEYNDKKIVSGLNKLLAKYDLEPVVLDEPPPIQFIDFDHR